MKKNIIKLYEYLYGISSGNQNFEYRSSIANEKIIDNFINKLTPSNGDDWLFNFMTYQFSRYIDQETRFGKGKIMTGWVLGAKAIQKFKDASEEELYYSDQFKIKFSVHNILLNPEDKILPAVQVSEYKNRERSRFFGTERGLIHCNENNLWDELSKWCFTCKYKGYCKK